MSSSESGAEATERDELAAAPRKCAANCNPCGPRSSTTPVIEGLPVEVERARHVRANVVRLEQEGPDALSARELMSLLVSGGRAESGAQHLDALGDLAALSRREARFLRRECGLSRAGAARLVAAFALGRRVEQSVREPRRSLRSPALVHDLMAGELRGLERETFHALLLDGKHRLQRRHRVSEGTLTCSLVHPREVFGPALREGAAALIAVHNHPSGDPEPSAEDLSVTRRLIEVGELLGIPLLDHVVIAEERYVSIRERMRFDARGLPGA